MIEITHILTPSSEEMMFIIEGMRNPMNSWDKSDSKYGCCGTGYCPACLFHDDCDEDPEGFTLGEADLSLMKKLCQAGTDHRKFMRMMQVYMRITAPLYWWKEFDTYKVGTVANSCSTMHKIAETEFTKDDFSIEHICDDMDIPEELDEGADYGYATTDVMDSVIDLLNGARNNYLATKQKAYWWQIIQMLPSSYNQTRNVMMNYEVLRNMYQARKGHKLDEWRKFCDLLEVLPYSELISRA